ncbi:transketolase [Bacteroides heparinolyticus]|uniref:Transketolase n=1 Tax=Prevotella heparinolytica TaxID=28113 RepID=A0A2R3MUI7_9BACE|nr:transketolase [Bacteroides heparinolyticus]AVM58658.1 transketolase [Bacteroides heparinolyticus]TCO88926.1 transketolase [Bacteroides heparinolyticus]
MMEKKQLFELAQSVRYKALEMAHNANESHSGGALSMADLLVTLYANYLNNTPETKEAPGRDRFILSKGHCCALYYAVLAEMGFIDMNELMENFAKNGTLFFAHATHKLPGVELSTGSLGHGMPVACGLALGAKRNGLNNSVYCLIGDGEINEGSNWEAIMFAAHNHLDNLCLIVDKNKMQALGDTKDVLCLDPLPEKLKTFQWNVIEIDGHDYNQIISAFDNFKECTGKPTVIVSNTIKGKGVSFMEHNLKFHYSAPNDGELKQAKEELL